MLLVSGSVGSAGWSVADSPFVLAFTLFLLEGIAAATGIAAVLAIRSGGTRRTWIVLGAAGGLLAVIPLVWFADLGRALVLAAPCAYLAVYAAVTVWRGREAGTAMSGASRRPPDGPLLVQKVQTGAHAALARPLHARVRVC